MVSTASVGADTSRPQRRGIELPVEWTLPKTSEFVGGGNLSPRNVAEQSGALNGSRLQLPPKLPSGEAGKFGGSSEPTNLTEEGLPQCVLY